MQKNVEQIIQYCNRAIERALARLNKLPPLEKWTVIEKIDYERNDEALNLFTELLDFIN